MLMYAFNKLNFERIDGGISDIHPASRQYVKKFTNAEGRQRHHFFRNGIWHDRLIEIQRMVSGY